jgi:hypothetical protein
MAFHPFQFFRKRQKLFLAVLTILTMVIFIFTGISGGCDQRAGLPWGRKGDTTPVTKLYGKAVTLSDFDQLRLNRRTAEAFITRALAQAAMPTRSGLDKEVQDRLQGMFARMQMGGIPAVRQQMRFYQEELTKDGKTDAARQVAALYRELGLEDWRINHRNELYFGGTLTLDSLLDFVIWRQQADKLGITLTDEDVRKEVNHEVGAEVLTGIPVKDGDKIASYLQGVVGAGRNLNVKDVYAALRDEFRVRLAQDALLGSAGGARSALGSGLASDDVPAGSTPEQFWEFFKDKRTTLTVDFLKVPVSQFTAQVKEQPTEAELQDLFKRYKNDEPSPERATPGFKVPRKVKVEWVAADPESSHYRDAAAKAVPLLPSGEALGLLALPQTFGGGAAGPLGTVGTLALTSRWYSPERFEYDNYTGGMKSWWDATSFDARNNNPYATGVDRPEGVAALVGQALGAAATQGTAWNLEGAVGGSIDARVAEQKVRQASMILAGSNPFPLAALAQEVAAVNVPVPPLATVSDEMKTRLRDRLAPEMAEAAIAAFNKEMATKNAQEAADYVAKSANAEHGITGHGAMTEAMDQTQIADAPALAPLRRAREEKVPLTLTGARQFAQDFLSLNQVYQPQPFHTIGATRYAYWLTQNDKPYVPNFTEAKSQVEGAWKLDKARALAREQAQHVVEAVKHRGEGISGDRFLNDEADRLKAAHPTAGYERFEALAISKLARREFTQFMPTLATEYDPYKFAESQIAYPRSDSVDELFKALDNPGDATLVRDRPDRNYYVAVLMARKVPSEQEFYQVYQKAPRGLLSDSLWSRFQAEREEKYRADVVRHLRAEAGAPLDEDGSYKIDAEVRRRIRSTFGGGDE